MQLGFLPIPDPSVQPIHDNLGVESGGAEKDSQNVNGNDKDVVVVDGEDAMEQNKEDMELDGEGGSE